MDELQNLEQLLQELLSGIQSVIQSGEILSDEFQGAVAQELDYLTTRIDELRATQAPPLLTDSDKSPIDSSVINAFKFDPKKGNLLVQFKGKFPNEKGSIYSYQLNSPEIFNLFRRGAIPAKTDGKNKFGSWWKGKNPSMGSSMNVLLKGLNLPYTKLS